MIELCKMENIAGRYLLNLIWIFEDVSHIIEGNTTILVCSAVKIWTSLLKYLP